MRSYFKNLSNQLQVDGFNLNCAVNKSFMPDVSSIFKSKVSSNLNIPSQNQLNSKFENGMHYLTEEYLTTFSSRNTKFRVNDNIFLSKRPKLF